MHARAPITRCTHNCRGTQKLPVIYLTFSLALAAPEKKEVKNGRVCSFVALDKVALGCRGHGEGSPTTDFAALWGLKAFAMKRVPTRPWGE